MNGCRALLLLLALGLVGCANLPSRDGPPAPVVESRGSTGSDLPPAPVVGPPAPPPPIQRSPLPVEPPLSLPSSSPAAGLLAEVEEAMASGDLERAGAVCERALRIAPREGLLWLRMAEIRLRQQRLEEALGFAQRAESLAGGNMQLARESRRMQERIRQQMDS